LFHGHEAFFPWVKQPELEVNNSSASSTEFMNECSYTILPVLYGCETWSLTLREEYRLRVFENRMLRKIFGPKRGEVTEELRKFHKEEIHDLYSSSNIVRVIKSRRMRWAGHVARMGRREACIEFWWGNLKERDHWRDPGVDGRIILRWIFRKWDLAIWTGLGCLRIETDGGNL
jgi:hypothetical protein